MIMALLLVLSVAQSICRNGEREVRKARRAASSSMTALATKVLW
jgi:hypothetical protein